jgi:hypothetical protein
MKSTWYHLDKDIEQARAIIFVRQKLDTLSIPAIPNTFDTGLNHAEISLIVSKL